VALKEEVHEQMQIFEQYLKVAILQHRANQIERKKIKKEKRVDPEPFTFTGGLVPYYDGDDSVIAEEVKD